MTTDAATEMRDRAREWGRGLLAGAPWDAVAERVSLLLVSPASGVEEAPATSAVWLVLDTATARSLPSEYRPLTVDEAIVERRRATATSPAVTLTMMTETVVVRLLQALTPRAVEVRWQVRHAEAIADRLRRGEQFALRAGMLPEDGLERIIRPLWLTASASARTLAGVAHAEAETLPTLLPAAGEVAADLSRIACTNDEGAYPPADLLLPAARSTRIGRRIAPWLDGLMPALAGDEAAARRTAGSLDQVLAEVQEVLAEQFRGRPWLNHPEAFSLRAPR